MAGERAMEFKADTDKLLTSHKKQTDSTKKSKKVERRQFSMGRDSIERLEKLRESTGATSHSEVIRNALRTYQYLTEEEAAGHRVLVEQADGTFVRLKML